MFFGIPLPHCWYTTSKCARFFSVKFRGSLARNDHFGSFFCENCWKLRTKRLFWKLFLRNLEKASYETLILEPSSVKIVGSFARKRVFLWRCFCGGVFAVGVFVVVFCCRCFFVVVFCAVFFCVVFVVVFFVVVSLCFCCGVFVVYFCCVFVVVFLWCGGVVVFLWRLFLWWWFLRWCFLLSVFLWWCFGCGCFCCRCFCGGVFVVGVFPKAPRKGPSKERVNS